MFPPPLHLWFKKKRKRNEERERVMAIPGEVLSRSVLGFVRSGVLCVCLLTVRRKQKRLEVCTHVRQPAQACMHYRVRRV